MSDRARSDLFLSFERWGWDERGWARSTRNRYLYRAKAGDRWLRADGSPPLVWAETEHLRRYLFSTPPQAGNRNDIRTALIGFFDFTIAQQWRVDNPAKDLPRLPVPKALPKALDIDQARRLVAMASTFGEMENVLLLTILYCGLRKSEARELEWRNVTDGFITVMGKGSKERSIPLHPHVEMMLNRWRLSCEDPRWVFPSPRRPGQPVSSSWMQNLSEDIARASGLPRFTLHTLRHTCLTRLLETGSNLREAQEFAGHASPDTTAIYTLVRRANLVESAERLDFAGPVSLTGVADAENG